MRLASMQPMQTVPIVEHPLKSSEVKPRGTEDPRALAQTESSAESEGAPQKEKSPEEGFVRFVEFIKRHGKYNRRPIRKKPKTRKECMVAAYRGSELGLRERLSRGRKFDKAG